MRRRRLWLLFAAGFLSACNEEESWIERYPIRVFLLQYVDPVIAPTLCSPGPAFVTLGAEVGFDDCQLETSSIEVRGDSLFVSGVARCVIRRSSWRIGAPARINPQMLSVPLPPLDPGDYTLCADGLCGGLTVTPACRPAQSAKLYAYGSLGLLDACPVFGTDMAFRHYEASGVDPPTPAGSVRIFATPTCSKPYCSTLCNPDLDGAIQVWTVDPVP